jgi:hypothetical protein
LELARQQQRPEFSGAAWRVLGLVAAQIEGTPAASATAPATAPGGTSTAETSDAVACFAESARIFAEVQDEAERARTLRAWARYEIDRGRRERGQALWQEARALFARMGMEHEAVV